MPILPGGVEIDNWMLFEASFCWALDEAGFSVDREVRKEVESDGRLSEKRLQDCLVD